MKNTQTSDLVQRLSAINVEKQNIEITRLKLNKQEENLNYEYNKIIQELWNRIPSLQQDVTIQKIKTKGKNK